MKQGAITGTLAEQLAAIRAEARRTRGITTKVFDLKRDSYQRGFIIKGNDRETGAVIAAEHINCDLNAYRIVQWAPKPLKIDTMTDMYVIIPKTAADAWTAEDIVCVIEVHAVDFTVRYTDVSLCEVGIYGNAEAVQAVRETA